MTKKHKKYKKHKNVKQTNKNKNDSYVHKTLNKQTKTKMIGMRIEC